MKLKLACLLFIVLPALTGISQDLGVTNVAKITILNPGFGYEMKTGKFQTLFFQAFMNTSAYAEYSSYFGYESSFYFDPAATAQYRFYYNAGQRFDKGKRTEMNSMNYLALVDELLFSKIPISTGYSEESSRRAVNRVGVVWGLQRNYQKHFSLDLNLGLGYVITNGTFYNVNGQKTTRRISQPTTLGQLNLGIWLNTKK
jgi:Protein of unknown function (DUF3575)